MDQNQNQDQLGQNQQPSPTQPNNQTGQIPSPVPNMQPSPVQPQQPPVAPPLPNQPDIAEPPPKSHPKTIFYILLILVVIITLAALSMIFLNFAGFNSNQPEEQSSNQLQEIPIPESTIIGVDQETQDLQTQGSSDEISDIEKDLKNTDLMTLDKELSSISSEINQ